MSKSFGKYLGVTVVIICVYLLLINPISENNTKDKPRIVFKPSEEIYEPKDENIRETEGTVVESKANVSDIKTGVQQLPVPNPNDQIVVNELID